MRNKFILLWQIGLAFAFWELLVVGVRAQTGSPVSATPFIAKHWTTEDGLPQNTVVAIVQTQDGYLWLGTFGGLARFDGLKFTIFNTSNTPVLKSNRITSLYVSRDGKLWIGTDACEIYYYRNGVFHYFETTGAGIGYNFIQTIYEDKAGAMYFSTVTTGLTRFDQQDPTQSQHFDRHAGLPDNNVTSISEATDGNLWVATPLGLVEFHNGKIISTQQIQTNPKDHPMAIFPHVDGGFWLSTTNSIGHFMDRRYKVHRAFANKSSRMSIVSGLTSALWFSPDTGDLFNEKSEQLFLHKTSLAKNQVTRSLFEDTEGNFWLGISGDGLYRISPRNISMLPYNVSSIIQDHRNNIWLSTEKGLCRIQDGQVTLDFRNTISAKLPEIAALYAAHDDTLWIGQFNGVTHLQQGKFTEYKDPSLGRVSTIAEDRSGQIWLGSQDGLGHFRDGQIKHYRASDGLVHAEVKVIFEDKEGGLWIGTVKGLSHFKDGVFTNYTTREGLSNDYIRDIYEDEDGVLWIATYGGGLNRFQSGQFEHITTKNGLPDDFISRILVDKKHQFWLLGNRGIFSLDRQRLNDFLSGKTKMVLCEAFGVSDGLDVTEGNGGTSPAGWQMQNGQLWFPMIRGIAIVTPDNRNVLTPLVAIEQVFLDRESQNTLSPIKIAPGINNLEIQYTGLALTKPEQLQFMYKLEGFDNDWIAAGSRRTALYSQLPPGNYSFRLIAANPAGGWSLHEATIQIKVQPRFWQTSLARILFGTFVLGLLLFIYYWSLSRLHRRASQKENFARQLIASQERERQRMAVEMHDGLSQSLVIIKRRALTGLHSVDDREQIKEQLQEIAEASTFALDEVKEIIFDLRPHQLDRVGVSEAISDLLDRVSAAQSWQIIKQLDNLDGALSKEGENNLYRIVQEGLNNISKHAAASQVTITINRKPHRLELMITDNGCGFVVKAQTDKWGYSGLGLQSIIERSKLLAGHMTIRSVPGHGTTLHLRFPIKDKL